MRLIEKESDLLDLFFLLCYIHFKSINILAIFFLLDQKFKFV